MDDQLRSNYGLGCIVVVYFLPGRKQSIVALVLPEIKYYIYNNVSNN